MLPGCLRFSRAQGWLLRAPHGLSLPSLVVRAGIVCKPVGKEAKEMAVLSWPIPHTAPRSPVQPRLLSSSQGADIPDLAPSLTHRFSAAESQLQPSPWRLPTASPGRKGGPDWGSPKHQTKPSVGLRKCDPRSAALGAAQLDKQPQSQGLSDLPRSPHPLIPS